MTEAEKIELLAERRAYLVTLTQSAKDIRVALDQTVAELAQMRPKYKTERIDFNNSRFHELVSVLNRFLIEMRLIEQHLDRLRVEVKPRYSEVQAEKDTRTFI